MPLFFDKSKQSSNYYLFWEKRYEKKEREVQRDPRNESFTT